MNLRHESGNLEHKEEQKASGSNGQLFKSTKISEIEEPAGGGGGFVADSIFRHATDNVFIQD